MLKDKTIFVTGGCGFIGASVAERLIEQNRVVVFDNLTRDSLSRRPFKDHPNLSVIVGDVRDADTLGEAMTASRPSHIVHCAAIAGVGAVARSPIDTMEVNTLGTSNVLRAAACVRGLERYVGLSTSEVYGQTTFRSGEDTGAVIGRVGVARWTYAVSKLAGEHLAIAYFQEKGLPAVVLRPFNIFGPGQADDFAVANFVRRARRNQDIEIHGDGTQVRAWCHVDDMARAVLLALDHPAAIGETFNIGNPRNVVTVLGLAKMIIRVLESSSRIVFVKRDDSDVELRVPDASKSRDILGFDAEIDLEQGIDAMVPRNEGQPVRWRV